eukprot:5826326-Pleurochrysis_carterae.AAC.3
MERCCLVHDEVARVGRTRARELRRAQETRIAAWLCRNESLLATLMPRLLLRAYSADMQAEIGVRHLACDEQMSASSA